MSPTHLLLSLSITISFDTVVCVPLLLTLLLSVGYQVLECLSSAMDPVFVKAYKLLFSNEPDSAEQLRGMLEHALKQRYGSSKSLSTVLPSLPTAQSVPLEVDGVLKPATQIPCDQGSDDSEESTESPEDDEDRALDLLQEELKCVVCKQINVGPQNLLVECLECHSLYHQECHQPPIPGSDTIDPRLAWYCATCKKKMDKTLATIKSSTVTSSSSKPTPNTSSRGSNKKSSPNSSSVRSFNPSLSESQVSKSSTRRAKSASGKIVTPVFTIITADQRFQQLKKKAAAGKKGYDKRKIV